MKDRKLDDAAHKWVSEFNQIPTAVIEKLALVDDVTELTECDEEEQSRFPMWGWMWTFGDMLDNEWIERGGLEALQECGFRVYEQEDFGYIFGIDGAGYDFYEEHWIPLYLARGLRWHEVDE